MAQRKNAPLKSAKDSASDALSLSTDNKNVNNVNQASLAALNALAAAYSMNSTTYSPFYPYSSMLPFGVPPMMPPAFLGDFSAAASSGIPFWPNMMGADYMLNMATLQNLQSPPSPSVAAACNGNGEASTSESFSDLLRKIPRPPSSGDKKDLKSAQTNAEAAHVSSSSNLQNKHKLQSPSTSAQSTAPHHFSLSTLAEVATSMKNGTVENKKSTSNNKKNNTEMSPPLTLTRRKTAPVESVALESNEVLDYSRKRPSSSRSTVLSDVDSPSECKKLKRDSTNDVGLPKSGANVKSVTSSSKPVNNSTSGDSCRRKQTSNSSSTAGGENNSHDRSGVPTSSSAMDFFTGFANQNFANLSSDLKMDPNLLNASAMAWAALSNQLFMAAGMKGNSETSRINSSATTAISSRPSSSSASASMRNEKGAGQDVGRLNGGGASSDSRKTNGKIVVDCEPSDSVDDTINAVIRAKMRGAAADHRQSQKSLGHPRARLVRAGGTVREQLAMRRANDDTLSLRDPQASASSSHCKQSIGGAGTSSALDLTVKTSNAPVLKPEQHNGIERRSSNFDSLKLAAVKRESDAECNDAGDSEENSAAAKKRRIVETELVRLPLTKGWRRQTCIRAISASGIRGDVIYYAPCGRRLGSYAEVVRYLNKNKIRDIGREHFCFSCKVLVGEFLHVRPDSIKNGIVPLSEKDVREMVDKFQAQHSASNAAAAVQASVDESNAAKSTRMRNSCGSRRRGRPINGCLSGVTSPASKSKAESLDMLSVAKSDDNDRSKSENIRKKTDDMDNRRIDQILKNNAIMEALRTNEKMELLRKQEEEYMRQVMILADWEREKNRQQALFARALEAKRRQEQREQEYAEKLIREEERLAARQAYLLKMKQQRLPVDDLELAETTKPLEKLDLVENLALDGATFADLLMVIEFVQNFGHVLKISPDEIPSLDNLHAALFNDKRHIRCLLVLTKVLLMLVLEYPGLPNGVQGKTFLGFLAKDSAVNFENLGELLRMFLQTRGADGINLAVKLENQPFESASAADKVAMLAFMCNELLYCRNVVREIETNMELAAKLKSDRTALEGKLRHLKAIQAIKQSPKTKSEVKKATTEVIKKVDSLDNASDDEKNDCDDDETLEKVRLKMIAETEPISVEEKNMSVEEVDKEVEQMSTEFEDMSEKMIEANFKVRSLPIGEDRYYRYYWALSRMGGVLVESLESVGANNPAVSEYLKFAPFEGFSEEVNDCLVDIVSVVESSNDDENLLTKYEEISKPVESDDMDFVGYPSCSNETNIVCEMFGKGGKRKHIPYEVQRGWWLVKDQETLTKVHRSLNSHGIRERLLARSLTKHEEILKRVSFSKSANVCSFSRLKDAKHEESNIVTYTKMRKILTNLKNLEEKVFLANVHNKGWKPPDLIQQLKNESVGAADDAESNSSDSDFSSEDEDSSSSSMLAATSACASKSTPADEIEQIAETVRKRLIHLEQNIERRYFHQAFNRSINNVPLSATTLAPVADSRNTSRRNSVVGSEMSDDATANCSVAENSNDVRQADDVDDLDEFDDATPALHRWRAGVAKARTSSQLSMCIESLDMHIAWERSVMKASCQICRRGDDDSQLLLCDGCDLGYHTYCFKPKLDTIPDGDWYCPECICKATRRPCCLLCCRQTTRPMIVCLDCQRHFHTDCVDTTKKQQSRSGWICDGCVSCLAKQHSSLETPKKSKSSSKKSKSGSKSASTNSKPSKVTTPQDKNAINASPKKSITKCASATPLSSSSPAVSTSSSDVPLHFNELCSIILAELDAHKDSWPFKVPVDIKAFPLYKKIIKRPVDLMIIQSKLTSQKYENADQFVNDVKLIFDNCKTFNEDESPVGKAGHSLRRFFTKRWRELKEMSARKT